MNKFENLEVMLKRGVDDTWSKVKLDHVDLEEGEAYIIRPNISRITKVYLEDIIPLDVYEKMQTTCGLKRAIVVLPKPYKYNCRTHTWETAVPTKLLKEIELDDPAKFDCVAQDNGDARCIDQLIFNEHIEKHGFEETQLHLPEIHALAQIRSMRLEANVEFLEYYTLDEVNPAVCYETAWGTKVYVYDKRITGIQIPDLFVLHEADKEITLENIINHKVVVLGHGDEWKEVTITITDLN